MTLDLFDDVFLLHLAFEAPEGVFQGFTVLESYFSQNLRHLPTDHKLNSDLTAAYEGGCYLPRYCIIWA
jgi:hypothetical protein